VELRLQRVLGELALREQDEAGRVAVDTMDDKRPPAAALPEIDLQILEDGWSVVPALRWQRHREEARRLVQDDQRVVLVDDLQVALLAERHTALRAPRPIHPQPDHVARREPRAGVAERRLAIVDEHLATVERARRARPRTGALRGGEILVEPDPRVFAAYRPRRHGQRTVTASSGDDG